MKSFLVFLIFCVLYVCGTPINLTGKNVDETETNLIQIINEIDKEQSFYLFGGLSIAKVQEKGRSNDESIMPDTFLGRIERFFNTHELQFNWPDINENNEIKESGRSESINESRTRKLRKVLLPLLIAIKLKLGLVLPILMLAIKAISLKGLAAGFLALLISGAQLLKDPETKKKEHITTAYITGHPLNAEIVHSTDWHRSGQASPQELAYSGYNYHALPVTSY